MLTLVEADGSSLNKQWLEFELTLYNIISPATRRWWHNNKHWSGQSLVTEHSGHSRSWRWHSAADPHTGEQYSRIERTNGKKQRSNTEVSTNIRFTNLKISILWEIRETIPRTWSSKVSFLSNFTPRMSRLGQARIEAPDKTKSPWEGSQSWI